MITGSDSELFPHISKLINFAPENCCLLSRWCFFLCCAYRKRNSRRPGGLSVQPSPGDLLFPIGLWGPGRCWRAPFGPLRTSLPSSSSSRTSARSCRTTGAHTQIPRVLAHASWLRQEMPKTPLNLFRRSGESSTKHDHEEPCTKSALDVTRIVCQSPHVDSECMHVEINLKNTAAVQTGEAFFQESVGADFVLDACEVISHAPKEGLPTTRRHLRILSRAGRRAHAP